MKVLHVIDSLGGSGGAEHGLVREILGFSNDVDQRVCRLFSKDKLQEELERAGVPVVSLDLSAANAGWNWPWAVLRLVREIRSFRPDVLHSSLFAANLVTQIAAKVTRTPVLSTFTLSGDRQLLKEYQPGADSFKATALRWVAARAARSKYVWFRALSKDALMTNAELLGVSPERVVVLNRGVPLRMVPEAPRSRLELGLPETGYIVLNIGRQTAQKGHGYLLEALASVHEQIGEVHLVIAGREGDSSESIRATIKRLGLEPVVTLTGYTPLVLDYLAHADVFAFSSVMEGLGTAVIEAMAAGVPVVAFDIPPVRESTDDGRVARLVPVGDVAGLAKGILDLMDPILAREYIAAGKRRVERDFSLVAVSAKLEQRLREVASG